MPAKTATSRTSTSNRSRLPVTPRVTTSRRGGHAPIRSDDVGRQGGGPARPAIHMTPDVIVAPRGTLSLGDMGRSFAEGFAARAFDIRRMRD